MTDKYADENEQAIDSSMQIEGIDQRTTFTHAKDGIL